MSVDMPGILSGASQAGAPYPGIGPYSAIGGTPDTGDDAVAFGDIIEAQMTVVKDIGGKDIASAGPMPVESNIVSAAIDEGTEKPASANAVTEEAPSDFPVREKGRKARNKAGEEALPEAATAFVAASFVPAPVTESAKLAEGAHNATASGEDVQPFAAAPARPGEATALLTLVKAGSPAPAQAGEYSEAVPVPAPASQVSMIALATAQSIDAAKQRIVPDGQPETALPEGMTGNAAMDGTGPIVPASQGHFMASQPPVVPAEADAGGGTSLPSPEGQVAATKAVIASDGGAATDNTDNDVKSGGNQAAPALVRASVVSAQDSNGDMDGGSRGKEGFANGDRSAADTASSTAAGNTQQPVASFHTPSPVATAAMMVQPPVENAADVGAALGRQVVDMGVSGQWIDDIARQIATVTNNPGQGSFRIASEQLGAVRVDIAQGAAGSEIRLLVDNEAAQAALEQDKSRLIQDAQMAALRIGDVRIERVGASADSQRGGTDGNTQNGNAQASQQAGAQTSSGQNSGQGQQSASRQDMMGMNMGHSSSNNAKTSFTRSVMNKDAAIVETAAVQQSGTGNARYA